MINRREVLAGLGALILSPLWVLANSRIPRAYVLITDTILLDYQAVRGFHVFSRKEDFEKSKAQSFEKDVEEKIVEEVLVYEESDFPKPVIRDCPSSFKILAEHGGQFHVFRTYDANLAAIHNHFGNDATDGGRPIYSEGMFRLTETW